jgi:hypothetical protein
MRTLLSLIATIILALPLAAQAPAVAEDAQHPLAEQAEKGLVERTRRDNTLESPILGEAEAVKFEAEKGEQKATALISFGGTTRRGAHIKLTAPVNKNADTQELSNLQGLTGTAKLELGYSGFLTDQRIVYLDVDAGNKLCESRRADEGCNLENLATERELFEMGILKLTGLTTAFGIKGEFTRTKFDYVTKDTLAAVSDSEPQYAGSIMYGAIPHLDMGRVVLYFAGIGLRYEAGYEAAKKQQICKPFSEGSPSLTCSETAVGAPTRSVKRIAELRTRWYASDDLGYDFVVYRDFGKDATGLELPVSFYRSKDGLFAGGITVGWRSDSNELTASVFIGAMKNLIQ